MKVFLYREMFILFRKCFSVKCQLPVSGKVFYIFFSNINDQLLHCSWHILGSGLIRKIYGNVLWKPQYCIEYLVKTKSSFQGTLCNSFECSKYRGINDNVSHNVCNFKNYLTYFGKFVSLCTHFFFLVYSEILKKQNITNF